MFRIQPGMPVGAMKTYRILQPVGSHFRPATCEEVECPNYANGWITRVPAGSDLAEFIASGGTKRHFRETTGLDQAEREFMFPDGQQCFTQHQVPLEREPFYVVQDGDWRGNPTGRTRTTTAEDWVDDFANNQDALKRAIQEG